MFCPIIKNECCETGCALWSFNSAKCALLLMGDGIRELSCAADDANFDCGIRVHVTKEREVDDED